MSGICGAARHDGGALLPGDFVTLVYEPYLNGATIQEGVWQTWDAIPGTWWASRPIIVIFIACHRRAPRE